MSKQSTQPNGPPNRSPQSTAAVQLVGPTLTVWIYDSAMGAAAGEVRLKDLRDRNALQVHDAVTVSWLPGAHRPRIGHSGARRRQRPRKAVSSGGLVDLIFFAPAAEAESGPGIASLARRLRDTGIDQRFLEEIKAQLRPETSALVVLSGRADLDEVRPVIERGSARGDVILMHALLSADAPDVLREAVHEFRLTRHDL